MQRPEAEVDSLQFLSMLLSFLQGQALEVKSIWDPLVHKTGSEVLRERERAPQQAV